MVVAVAKYERAQKNAAFPAAEHRVPHRRGVIGGADPVPGPVRLLTGGAKPGLDKAGPGSHPARLSVNEENAHRQRG